MTSDITVALGGKIEGVGATSGSLTAAGIVAPGNSPGTLSVAGDVTFASTNTFVTELDGLTYNPLGGAGSFDRLAVTGTTATFTAGGTVTPILRGITSGNNLLDPVYGDVFRVVTTANATGVSGTFLGVTDPSSGMPTNSRFDVIYGANYIDLVLTPGSLAAFVRAYGIQNMTNAATALDGVRPTQGTNGTTDMDRLFNGLYRLTAPQISLALLQASGEIHAFGLSDARDGWQTGVGIVRSASANATRNYWVDASGYNLSVSQDSIGSSHNGISKNLWIGTDLVKTDAYTLGVAVGTSSSEISTVSSGSSSAQTTAVAGYLRGQNGAFEYDGIVSINRSKINTSRDVDLFTDRVTNTSASKVSGGTVTSQIGYRYDLDLANVSSLVWLRGDIDLTSAKTFTEQGSSITALTVGGYKAKSADLSLGYTVTGKIVSGDMKGTTWNIGVGAAKQVNNGMEDISRTMSLHGASWNVSVPKAGDITKFANVGFNVPLGEQSNAWLNLSIADRSGYLSKGAAFGILVQW